MPCLETSREFPQAPQQAGERVRPLSVLPAHEYVVVRRAEPPVHPLYLVWAAESRVMNYLARTTPCPAATGNSPSRGTWPSAKARWGTSGAWAPCRCRYRTACCCSRPPTRRTPKTRTQPGPQRASGLSVTRRGESQQSSGVWKWWLSPNVLAPTKDCGDEAPRVVLQKDRGLAVLPVGVPVESLYPFVRQLVVIERHPRSLRVRAEPRGYERQRVNARPFLAT